MKLHVLLTAIALAAIPASAQRHKLAQINTETEEGKALQVIGMEQDQGRKLALMDEFAAKHSKHEAVGWVLSQLQDVSLKAGNFDKTIATGEKLLALDGGDFDATYLNLKAAEGKKDPEGILKWGAMTADLARKSAQAPKGPDQDADEYKQAVDHAKQAGVYAEYALSAAAATDQDPARIVKLTEALGQSNPQSQYLPSALPRYAWAARQANALPSAAAFGGKLYEQNVFHEDLLLTMTDYQMQQKNSEKVSLYSAKIVELMGSKPKPDGVSDSDWAKKKNTTIGLAYWMEGTAHAGQNRYPQADKALRSALPLIGDNEQLTGPALFFLGLANYQMGKGKNAQQMADALKFMQQSAAIKGPYQAKAQSNVAVMRKETSRK